MRSTFKSVVFMFVFLNLLTFVASQGLPAGTGGDIEGILRRGKLVVAITAVDQPPFYFVDKNGKLTGYDIDLASKMADELGVKLEITRDAPAFNDLVVRHKVNCLSAPVIKFGIISKSSNFI